jgi:Cft2 family RNA processing exonuclease
MKMEGADNQDIFTFDDIDTAFQNTVTVKYNQRITLQEKGTNIHGSRAYVSQ